jgi:germination protein M
MKTPGRTAIFAAVTVAALVVGGIFLSRLDTRRAATPEPAPPERAADPATPALSRTPVAPPGENYREIVLFFQSPREDLLAPEKRKILWTESVTDQARETVLELIEGPRTGLLPTLPAATGLREIYLREDGTAYVDLDRKFVDNHPGGSSAEIETVFSIVNTLTFNFPEIQRVKILVEGEERATLKEHLDLTRAWVADMSIVAGEEAR